MRALIPTPSQTSNVAANVFDKVFRGGLADLRPTPGAIIEEAPQCTVFRYLVPDDGATRELPVLLVPPLAVSPACFDLRRGCSLVEHMLALGHPTYLVEYGEIGYSDRDLGLEHWVEDVIPRAIRRVSEDNGGAPVQLVGWCLGGIMATLALAGEPLLPVQSITMIASPFDFTRVRRRPRPARAPRLPAVVARQVPDQAADDADPPRRPRLPRPARGRRQLRRPDARLPGPDLRPALSPLLPRQRHGRGRRARARRPPDRPRRRARARPLGGRIERHPRPAPGRPCRRRPARERAGGAARDRSGRAPRRADRPLGEAQHLGLRRRVPRAPRLGAGARAGARRAPPPARRRLAAGGASSVGCVAARRVRLAGEG